MLTRIKKFFRNAVRTSMLAHDKITGNWIHLFSVIELQTNESYPYYIQNEKWKNNCVRTSIKKLNGYSFYLCIDEIPSIERAIAIFHNPLQGYEIDGRGIKFLNTIFVKEPSGASPLVFPPNTHKTDGLSSVLPKRNSGVLVWCQIDSERLTEREFISPSVSKEMQAIRQLSIDWLGFDLAQQSEHLGNIYLSAPNPYFREVEVAFSKNPIGVFYKIHEYRDIKEPLIFRIIDIHGDAIAFDGTFKIKNPVGIIELPHEPNLFELRIYNSNNDLVGLHERAAFLKSIQVDMSIKQADLHVKAKTDKGESEFIVEKFGKDSRPSIIGKTPSDFSPEYYFKNAKAHRKHVEHKENKEFVFFSGAKTDTERMQLKEEAKALIRELLNRAKDSCYICDPYFNSTDIVDYALRIQQSSVKIRILNSKEYIKKTEAKKISSVVNDYNELPFNKIEVRMLKGDSILHDRFIVVDTNVWYVGSSFNEFGNRATCIAKVPDSSNIQIIKEIEKWFMSEEYSGSIDDYAKSK